MNKIWYNSPAKRWREALPIGNGHTGVMIYGGKRTETLCFNDGTLWSGYPKDYNSSDSLKHLEKVRELIFAGRNSEADKLSQEKLCGFYSETFLPLGSAKIKIKGAKGNEYKRFLDLSSAVHTVKFGNTVREAFASNPDNLVCYNIKSDKLFSAVISMKSKLHYSVKTDKCIALTGNAPDYAAPNYLRTEKHPIRYNEHKGMAFALCCKVNTDGTVIYTSKRIKIKNATYATLYFATATGFKSFNQMPDISMEKVLDLCKEKLKLHKTYEQIKAEHIADFNSICNKSAVSFADESSFPTDKLIKQARNGNVSSELIELFYNYGKYMTVSASRKGGQAMNLQGIWNNSVRPPWSSNYTVNINTQMNYWGASRANLSECIEPLLQMVYEAMQNGRKTAQINYGCDGFACNHNVDIWRKTPPVQGTCNYMLEPLCGVWLANEIFAHYQNGALQKYSDKVLEIVKEAAQFASDYLVLYNGKYVICPSPSAENSFINNGEKSTLDYASAFNMGLVKQVFSNYLSLNFGDELSEKIKTIQPALFDFQYGKTGVCEYHKDYEMPERGHRHFSPLYAFYPANVIKYYENREQTEQVRKLFYDRINHSKQYIGWSAAWGICLAARLHDREKVETIIQKFLGHSVFKNLFCVHPPFLFQIDGNLGFVAGVHEMLIYEENDKIELLPALPDNLQNGKAENLLVNGINISFEWKNSKVISISADKKICIMKSNLSDNINLNENVMIRDN